MELRNLKLNATKRAIHTFKDHFIAGLCTTDEYFPAQLWDRLLDQGQDSLNTLHKSIVHLHLFAYVVLEGVYDFNKQSRPPEQKLQFLYKYKYRLFYDYVSRLLPSVEALIHSF